MIRIEPQPEPPDFDATVRQPGRRAIAELRGKPAGKRPGPKREPVKHFRSKHLPPLWRECLDTLYTAYGGVCAYASFYIPRVVGSRTTDHYEARAAMVSTEPEQAYEWSNFRLACGLMNSRKGDRRVIDPFAIEGAWFQLDLSTLGVRPDPQLEPELRDAVGATIKDLGLDDPELRQARADWYQPYLDGQITFSFLKAKCPFLALEIERQLGDVPEQRRR